MSGIDDCIKGTQSEASNVFMQVGTPVHGRAKLVMRKQVEMPNPWYTYEELVPRIGIRPVTRPSNVHQWYSR